MMKHRSRSISEMTPAEAAVVVERLIRGFVSRRRAQRLKLVTFRERYQAQFDTMEKLIRFRFRQHGAAFVIQRWFHRWTFRNKEKWMVKYAKMVKKYEGQKLLYQAIQKSQGYAFTEKDFDNALRYKHSSALVIGRIVRGFLGRRRFTRLSKSRVELAKRKRVSIVKIQAFVRRMLAILRRPQLGLRFRLLQQKMRRNNGHVFNLEDVEGVYPEDFDFAHHRIATLYPQLRLGKLDKLDLPALKIQRNWRRYHATFKFQALVTMKKSQFVIRIQRWSRHHCWRRKMLRALSVIQPLWREKAQTAIRRKRAAIMIQSKFRAYSKHQWLKKILNVRRYCAVKTSSWLKYRLGLRRVRKILAIQRMTMELTKAGALQYANTELRWFTKFLWQGLRKTKNVDKGPHELQRIFSAHSLNNGLDLSKILKLLKDCKGNLIVSQSPGLTTNAIELQFAKVKYGNDKRIDYSRFLDLIANLALLKFFQLDPVKGMWEEGASAMAKVDKANMVSLADNEVTMDNLYQYCYGSQVGKAALVTRFVKTYLMTLEDFEKAEKVLGSQAASAQCQAVLSSAVQTLQRFISNRWSVRNLTQRLVEAKHQKMFRNRFFAATMLQKLVRGFVARRKCIKRAQAVYMKYIDGETEKPYWSNTRTKLAFWTKPKLLRELDSGIAIRMPPDTEVYTMYCSQCEEVYAANFCVSCNTCYCLQCYVTAHSSGQRKSHQYFAIDHCIQCDFQIGTCQCLTCQDLFCDSCYRFVHLKGRLRFHTFQRHGNVCYACHERAAQWRELLPFTAASSFNTAVSGKTQKRDSHVELHERHWCTKCYYEEYNVMPKETHPKTSKGGKKKATENVSPNGNVIEKLPYVSRAYTKHLEDQKKATKEAEIARAYQVRQEELARLKKENAALNIQRYYRGYQGRLKMQAFIEERKQFLALRKAEDEERNSIWYWLRNLIGVAPLLDSDTPLERVKKVYPWYMHHIVGICIENKWSEACKLMTEHDLYMKHHAIQNASLVGKLSAKLRLRWKQQQVVKDLKDIDLKTSAVDNASAIYYEAQLSGAVPENKLKLMKKQLNKMEKEKQNAIDKHEKTLEHLKEAENRVTQYYGPRRLQKLIADRRKNGILLPFRVRMKRNSRYAMVVQWITNNNPGLYPPGDNVEAPHPADQQGEGQGYYDEYGNYIPVNANEEDGYYWDDEQQAYIQVDSAVLPQSSKGNGFAQGPEFQSLPFSDNFQSAIPEEGAWKQLIKTGDNIYIQGIKFTIAPSINKKKSRPGSGKSSRSTSRPTSAKSSKSSNSSRPSSAASSQSDTSDGGSDAASSDAGSDTDGKSKKKKRKKMGTSSKSSKADEPEIPDFDNEDDFTPSGKGKGAIDPKLISAKMVKGFELEVKEELTADHICLNRPWVLDDMEIVEVFKVVPRVFYAKPAIFLKDVFVKSFPAQKIIAVMAITMHKISKLTERLSQMFEEETSYNVYFRNTSLKTMKAKYRWLSMSYSIVQMSYDFSLRRQFARHLLGWWKFLKKYLKIVYNLYKSAKTSVKETPYEYWHRSLEKDDVVCYFEINSDNIINLGTIKLDIKAPVEILREYFYRNFRDTLNETVGESFLFQHMDQESGREEILPRDDEFRTVSKLFLEMRTDQKTFVSSYTSTIVKDRERGRVFIQEIIDKKEEEEELDSNADEDEALESMIKDDKKK